MFVWRRFSVLDQDIYNNFLVIQDVFITNRITRLARNKSQEVARSLFPRLVHNCFDRIPSRKAQGNKGSGNNSSMNVMSQAHTRWRFRSRHWQITQKKLVPNRNNGGSGILPSVCRILLHRTQVQHCQSSISLKNTQGNETQQPAIIETNYALLLETQMCTIKINTNGHLQDLNPSQRLILPAIRMAFCIIGALAGFL